MRQANKFQVNSSENLSGKVVKENQKSIGLYIRTGIRAGNWLCSSCQGKTQGSNLFQPHCQECVKI